ncbi:transcription factor Adf-1-like [Acanthaster planci]|uniref:Transcription factor Adf-1-like n=1 Tax=Acanthaster planci TaxID=133434 RepID=A0A8B7ZD94_ACAPL|nr:transcription factor Adf-1-like [Acanthaster planci]
MAAHERNSNESLILEVQRHPLLYDTSLNTWKGALQKRDVWETVGARLDMPGTQAAKRWKDIWDAFVRSKNKQKMKSGKAGKKVKPQRNITANDDSDVEYEIACSGSDKDSELQGEPSEAQQDGTSSKNSFTTPVPLHSDSREQRKEESYQFQERQHRAVQGDEDDMFFQSMAAICRKLPPPLRSRVKFQVHKVLYAAEMEQDTQSRARNSKCK